MSEFHIDYAPISQLYAHEQITGTLYLAFRDIPYLLNRYLDPAPSHPLCALDFGCGTGVSTRYLKSLLSSFPKGLTVEGVDVSEEMLQRAKEADSKGVYRLIKNGIIPAADSSYDLILSTFVLFEFASKTQMTDALKEIKRIMRPQAIFIAVTGSAEAYNRNCQWVSLQVDFPQNENLVSGQLGRVDFVMPEGTLTFQNYYWTRQDYQEAFQEAGLVLLDILQPHGTPQEEKHLSWKWKSELTVSPYYIFVSSKNDQA